MCSVFMYLIVYMYLVILMIWKFTGYVGNY